MKKEEIIEQAEALYERVVGFRRHIHRHPELSFEEHATADFIIRTLAAEGIECTPIAGTGVLAKIVGGGAENGSGGTGAKSGSREAVVLRADIDALPVHEATGLGFASTREGVMHACGHDMHAASLMGALILINRRRNALSSTLFGLFQPAEELLPGGAVAVLAEEPFKDYNIRAFIGQHVDGELPTGTFGVRAGEYMASTDEIYITVRGEGGHAAMPAQLKNPIPAAATLILEFGAIETAAPVPCILSIGRVIADGATNIVPDNVVMEGTMRTFDEEWRSVAKERISAVATSISAAYSVAVDADVRTGYPCVKNDAGVAAAAREVLSEVFGAESVVALERRMTGEDFGLYTQRYPSLFYRFGVGGSVGDGAGRLHSACFNPDEEALKYGVAGLVALAFKI